MSIRMVATSASITLRPLTILLIALGLAGLPLAALTPTAPEQNRHAHAARAHASVRSNALRVPPAARAPILAGMAPVISPTQAPSPATTAITATIPAGADLTAQADQLSEEAYTLYQQGDLRGALDKFDAALALYRRAGDRAGEATTLADIGSVHYGLGQYAKALDLFAQALAVSRDIGDRASEGTILNNIGLIHINLGDYGQALEELRQALAILQEVGDRAGEGSTLGNIALVYNSLGQYAQSLEYCQQAITILQEVGDLVTESIILNNIGTTYHHLGQYTKALDYYQRSLAIAREAGDRAGEGTAVDNIATVYASLDDDNQVLNFYQQALAIRRAMGDRAGEGVTLNNIGFFYAQQEQPTRALEYYQLALTALREVGDRASEGITLNNIGEVHHSQGQDAKALALYQQALVLSREVGDRVNESRLLTNIGLVHERAGEPQQALDLYRQAIALDESIRDFARLEEFKTSLAEQSAFVYERAALLLMQLNEPEHAFNMAERARARTFLDQLGNARIDTRTGATAKLIQQEQDLRLALAELERALAQERAKPRTQQNPEVMRALAAQLGTRQNEYDDLLTRVKLNNPEYASMVTVAPLTLTETQALLDGETTLLDYFVTVSSTLAFVITHDSFQALSLPVGKQSLRAAVAEFRRFDRLDDLAPDSLASLYEWLIAPLQSLLKTRTIGIIPHGPLHYLPFAALPSPPTPSPTGRGGTEDQPRYFGGDHTLFLMPSASVLPFVRGKQKKGSPSDVLAFAFAQPMGLEALAYAGQEAQDIATLFSTRPLLDADASESAFKRQAGEHRIVHVAAHGEFNLSNALFSRLVLSPDASDDGSLELHEVYGLDLHNTDLVVLSACETQLGRQSQGDDIVALNRAFMYAGTPTVVASLWSVNDEATSQFMRSFYQHLKEGTGKAEALRAAQAELRTRYPHPFYWAAFVLTGDPGAPLSTAPAVPAWAIIAVAIVLLLSAALLFIRWRSRSTSVQSVPQ